MIGKLCCGLFVLAVVTGCAGQHVRPSANYAQAEERVVRVAFDQNGDTYPRSTSSVDWSSFTPSWYQSRFGGPFELRKYYEQNGGTDWAAVQLKARQDVVQQLNMTLKDGDTLVILIHGFNNTYDDARSAYDSMHKRVTVDRSKLVFLEVFWDGLKLRSGKTLDMAGYASFWPDALTYSNFAGQYGLRPLLNAVDKDVDVRFVTHSRGIGVALSALADPTYSSDIVCPDGQLCAGDARGVQPPLANGHLRSVKIAAFAPAVGNGHLNSGLDSALSSHPVQLLAGVNTKDFATSKWVLSSRFWGDTSLGSDPRYVLEQQFQHRENLDLRVGLFKHGSEHGLDAYFSEDDLTNCFFATVDLRPAMEPICKLVRLN